MPLPEADSIPIKPKPDIWFWLARILIEPVLRACFRFRVERRAPLPHGPYVAIANHLSWLDAFCLLLALPKTPHLHFLANPQFVVRKRWQWFIICKVGGFIPVDLSKHGDTVLFEQAYRCLESGAALGIFPEGETGTEGQLGPFKKGFAHFALRANTPIVPLAIVGSKDLWLRKEILVTIGKYFRPDGRSVEDLPTYGREQVLALLPSTLPTYRQRLKPLRRFLSELFS